MSFYITTPIYYVNAKPHLGHAYTTIVADSLRRFHHLCGESTFFLTGTDEHGDKIVQAAEAAGESPQAFVDGISGKFQALWPQLGIVHDDFIRTTEPRHKQAVQDFLQKVYDAGDIYFGEFGGHYCTGCERFYTEKELENGLCPQHQTKPEFIQERNYFFKMSKYLPWLQEHLKENPEFIRPERYRNEVLAMLEGGVLEDLCISRPKTRLEWGIELPFDKDYVCYVWFDALINYISALNWPAGEKYQNFWPAEHLVAKDILKPHGVFWPTMLKAAGLPLFKHLNVHGYWLVRDTKMSKSLGNSIDPVQLSQTYGLDAFRYFLLREMHFGSDASFSEEALIGRINSDLANDLGNLFSRVLSMNAKYFAGHLPAWGEVLPEDAALVDLAQAAQLNYEQLFRHTRLSQGLESLWEVVRALNKYVDSQAPWALHKQGQMDRLAMVLRVNLECMTKIALCLWPVMPKTAQMMLEQLTYPLADHASFGQAPAKSLAEVSQVWPLLQAQEGQSLAISSNLFPRLEVPKADKVAAAKSGKSSAKDGKDSKDYNDAKDSKTSKASQAEAGKEADKAMPPAASPDKQPSAKGLVEFADWEKLDLRIATVLEVEKHPKADKLLCFKLDMGEDKPRQVISGIAEFFKPEELVGRQVCVVANLAPRKIRGLESQGMILTAETTKDLSLLTPGRAMEPGSKIS